MNVLVIVRSFPAHEESVYKASTCRRLFSWLLVVIFRFSPHPCLVIYVTCTVKLLSASCLNHVGVWLTDCIYCDNSNVPLLVCFIACCRESPPLLLSLSQQRSKVRSSWHLLLGCCFRGVAEGLKTGRKQLLIGVIFACWVKAVSCGHANNLENFKISTSGQHLSNVVMVPSLSWSVTC